MKGKVRNAIIIAAGVLIVVCHAKRKKWETTE